MARPFKHPKTGVYWFRKAVPAKLRPLLGKTEVLRSLRTKDVAEARVAHAAVAAEVDAHWRSLQSSPSTLSHRQSVALAGRAYADLLTKLSDDPGTEQTWSRWAEIDDEERSSGRGLDGLYGETIDDLLRREGIAVDQASRDRLLEAVSSAIRQAAGQLQRNAAGDYSPDPKASRFPEWKPPEAPQAAPKSTGRTSLTGILEDWWREAKAAGRKPSTYESYSKTVAGFVAFLRHDDATRVTPEDVIGFKDHRLTTINPKTGRAASPKTVKDSDLSGLKTLFSWAAVNRRVSSNPAKDVTVKVGRRQSARPKGFTDEEAAALLKAADARVRAGEHPKTFAAKRWVPWLCAYTGARVGEIAQLRRQDVRCSGTHWVIHITPDAGTVKTDQSRDVVLHSHLVEKGFPKFVEGSAEGHLFLTPASDGDVRGPLRGLKNRLADAARETVKDHRVQPNHGWRHRFKTTSRSFGMDGRIVDAIQGHAPKTAGDDYGDVTIAAIALTVAKMPRQDEFPEQADSS